MAFFVNSKLLGLRFLSTPQLTSVAFSFRMSDEKVAALVEALLAQLKHARPAADGSASSEIPLSVWSGLNLVFGSTLLTAVHLGACV